MQHLCKNTVMRRNALYLSVQLLSTTIQYVQFSRNFDADDPWSLKI